MRAATCFKAMIYQVSAIRFQLSTSPDRSGLNLPLLCASV